MAEKKATQKTTKQATLGIVYVISKANGTIERTDLSPEYIKVYEKKGYTVKKKGVK